MDLPAFLMMVVSYIDYIIRHNAEGFKQVGFIGTPFENTVEQIPPTATLCKGQAS